jgi:hypothetical protein
MTIIVMKNDVAVVLALNSRSDCMGLSERRTKKSVVCPEYGEGLGLLMLIPSLKSRYGLMAVF